MEKEELMTEAIFEMERSYSPYSHFKVGAALLTKDGQIYYGTNIENSSYGLTMCAERNAIFNAYSNGVEYDDIEAIAIVGDTQGPVSPCGACRQVMSELIPHDAKIYLGNLKGDIMVTNIDELLPYQFSGNDL